MSTTPDPQTPPEPHTYTYVMRRIPDFDPWLTEQVYGYDESPTSRDIVHPDGVRRVTVFMRSDNLRQRMLCEGGWDDVTDQWTPPATTEGPATPPRSKQAQRSLRVAG